VGILAVGMTLVIIAGGIDLSVGSMMAMLGTFAFLAMAKMTGETSQVFVCVFVCLGSGLLVGFLNGFLITTGRIAPFIATLAGLVGYRSVAVGLGNAGQLNSTSKTLFPSLAQGGLAIPGFKMPNGQPILLYWPIFLMLFLAIIGSFILNRTTLGRKIVAVGANEQAAHYSGIATHKVRWWTYSAMGFCVAIATLCQAADVNVVSTNSDGLYKELDAIAAVVVGGTSLNGGKGQVWLTIVGVLIIGMIDNILTLASINNNWQGCVKGVIIVLAVLLQRGSSSRS
jgi:ribose transport system permease protein